MYNAQNLTELYEEYRQKQDEIVQTGADAQAQSVVWFEFLIYRYKLDPTDHNLDELVSEFASYTHGALDAVRKDYYNGVYNNNQQYRQAQIGALAWLHQLTVDNDMTVKELNRTTLTDYLDTARAIEDNIKPDQTPLTPEEDSQMCLQTRDLVEQFFDEYKTYLKV